MILKKMIVIGDKIKGENDLVDIVAGDYLFDFD